MNENILKAEAVEKLSFEDALKELENIVESLESGQVSLDDAISAFERGTLLKTHCQKRLEEAQMRIEKIKVPASGEPPERVEPFHSTVDVDE